MGTDIRLPIGLFFALIGVILAAYGLLGDSARDAQPLGVNINLVWGCVLAAFGVLMIFLGRRGNRESRAAPPADRP